MSGLLRICTAGSVDDGKSTLIGRLLYDSRSVYEDQVHSVEKASKNRTAGPIDFSLFTDGLKAEREQGITIDVAYRYFATARRKFILAGTPGHEQYTRNMATGASTADVAILLVDARNGVRAQSRRHAQIARLLGISDYVLAVNKMDLVGFDQDVFENITDEFEKMLPGANVHAIPISALEGDNVITRSTRTPWFDGMALLEFLETVHISHDAAGKPFRFPVQLVLRPNHEFRGYAGQVASGSVRPGDVVMAWPSGRATRVTRIVTWDGDLDVAHAGMSVTLTLADEIDISRGDMLSNAAGAAALLRSLRREPRHRQLHPDRSLEQLHRRCRDDFCGGGRGSGRDGAAGEPRRADHENRARRRDRSGGDCRGPPGTRGVAAVSQVSEIVTGALA